MSISYKESRESHYWLRILHDSNYIDENAFQALIRDCDELIKILSSITKTMEARIKNSNF